MNRRNVSRVLTPAALVMAGIAVGTFCTDALRPSAALAQSGGTPVTSTPPFDAARQREMNVQMLTEIRDRVAKIETKLNAGISVKVTEMPPVTINEKN